MRTYTDVFIYDDDLTKINLSKLSSDYKGNWILRFNDLGIFMTDEQLNKVVDVIGREFWNIAVPELVDPEEEYNEQLG